MTSTNSFDPRAIPTVPVEIDWGHQLTQNLVGLYIPAGPNGLVDLTGNNPALIPQSNAFITRTQAGLGYNHTTGNAGLYVQSGSILRSTGPQTIVWYGYNYSSNNGNTSNNALIAGLASNSHSSAPYLNRCIWNASDQSMIYAGDQNSNRCAGITYGNLPAGQYTLAATFAASNVISLFANGKLVATGTGGAQSYSGDNPINIGLESGAGASYSMTITGSAAWYNRLLTPDELAWLNIMPFAMIKPTPRRKLYMLPSGVSINNSNPQANSGFVYFVT